MASGAMPESVAKRLGYALKRAQHALRISMDDALRPIGITTPQYAVMCAVEAEPGMSNARLARAAFVTAQTMQGVLANLERDGLITRRADLHHGRALRNDLTARGRRLLLRAHTAVGIIEDLLVDSFGEATASRMAVALNGCAENLSAHQQSI